MKIRKRRFSIQNKLMKMSMVISVIAVMLTCILFIAYSMFLAHQSLAKELLLVTHIIGSRDSILENKSVAGDSLNDLRLKKSINLACLYNTKGNIVAKYSKFGNLKCPAMPPMGESLKDWNTIAMHNEIATSSKIRGSLYIESDLRDITEAIPKYIGFAGLLLSIVMLFVYFISSSYQKLITEPILHLLKMAHYVVKEDDYSVRVTKYDNDEIGDLTGAFNKIMDQVYKERENLESNVRERTSQLEEAKIKAEAVNKAKSEFLRNMSHEFRTPLHGLLSFSSYGLNEAQTAKREDLHKYFSRINQVGNRLLKLVEAILSIAQLESGKEALDIKQNDLYNVVQSSIREQQALFQERGISIHIEEPKVSTEAEFDMYKMVQVVTNILGNSVKFTPTGKQVKIYFDETRFSRDKRRKALPAITLSIEDQGIGIPEDELETIFDKFVQSSRTDNGAGGTGLGLSIASGIVRMHDGLIVAANSNEGGAIFTITIPRETRK